MRVIKIHLVVFLEYLPLMDSEVREPQHWQHQHSAPFAKVFFDKLKQERKNLLHQVDEPSWF